MVQSGGREDGQPCVEAGDGTAGDPERPVYRVVDTLGVELERDQFLSHWVSDHCLVSGSLDSAIVALLHVSDQAVPGGAITLFAWRFSAAAKQIVAVDPAAVDCPLLVP